MKKQILHLGCGNSKKPGAIGVDILAGTHADVIHNLNKFPYPFKSSMFNEIIAENIMEHLENIPKVMEEIHRISRSGARIKISTGHFSSVDSFTDPTHKHFFTSRTFDYFIPKTDLYKYQYSKLEYKKISVHVGTSNPKSIILKVLLAIINKYLIYYEKRFAFLFPVGSITYELEVVKNGKS